MIILFPMNGTGERFKQAGFKTIKPLIKVGTKPLIDWVKDSYPIPSLDIKHVEIIRPEMIPYFSQSAIVINKQTRGPLETILRSAETVKMLNDIDQPLLIADCDSIINKPELLTYLAKFRANGIDGGVTIKKDVSDHLSYARIDGEGFVEETREKDVFSEWSTTGPYYWKSSKMFLTCGRKALNDRIWSICPVYNYLIKEGGRVKAFAVHTFKHLGTPDDLKAHAKYMRLTLSE